MRPARWFLGALLALAVPAFAQSGEDPPSVSSVAVTSDPGDDETYGPGDPIEVTVTFSSDVTVTGTPQVALDIGGDTRQAAFRSGSGSAALVFSYTVAAGDEDADGVEVKENGLDPNGGSIRAGSVDAARTFEGVLAPHVRDSDRIAPAKPVARSGSSPYI